MKLLFVIILNSFVLLIEPALAISKLQQSEGEKVLSCEGVRKSAYDPVDTFGPKLNIEVWQTPARTDYRWILKIAGKHSGEQRTNGPINEDGTTIAPNGDDGIIMYNNFGQGVSIKKINGVLQGIFNYVEALEGKPVEYYLVEYELSCEKSIAKIDQREADVYTSTSQLADLSVSLKNPWLTGVGVSVSETGLALGVAVYAKDEDQKNAFIEEFVKRGLVIQKEKNDLFYKYTSTVGRVAEIPLFIEIVGDVGPIP